VPKFLSPEWVAAATAIRDEADSDAASAAAPQEVKMNLVITESPFGDDDIHAFMDSSGGSLEMDLGELDDAELTVTVDYETAKAIFVDQNPQAGMQAFMAGKVKVMGDMTKLMAMQQQAPDAAAMEIQKKIQEITE